MAGCRNLDLIKTIGACRWIEEIWNRTYIHTYIQGVSRTSQIYKIVVDRTETLFKHCNCCLNTLCAIVVLVLTSESHMTGSQSTKMKLYRRTKAPKWQNMLRMNHFRYSNQGCCWGLMLSSKRGFCLDRTFATRGLLAFNRRSFRLDMEDFRPQSTTKMQNVCQMAKILRI